MASLVFHILFWTFSFSRRCWPMGKFWLESLGDEFQCIAIFLKNPRWDFKMFHLFPVEFWTFLSLSCNDSWIFCWDFCSAFIHITEIIWKIIQTEIKWKNPHIYSFRDFVKAKIFFVKIRSCNQCEWNAISTFYFLQSTDWPFTQIVRNLN